MPRRDSTPKGKNVDEYNESAIVGGGSMRSSRMLQQGPKSQLVFRFNRVVSCFNLLADRHDCG
jgi:hypothetical protein